MKITKHVPALWIGRRYDGMYEMGKTKKSWDGAYGFRRYIIAAFLPKEWRRLFPGIILRAGDGPVKMELSLRLVKQ